MKKKLLILITAAATALAACSGNDKNVNTADSADNGNLSDSNAYKVDTSKTTDTTGDASLLDNSASGGTRVKKIDSGKINK